MKISLIAPSSGLVAEVREKFLQKMQSKQPDFQFHNFVHLDPPADTPFLAASDSVRWKQLQLGLKSKDPVLWCLRGGYGAIRLLPQIAKLKKPSRAPVLLGISDATILHLLWNLKWKKPSLYGPLFDRVLMGKLPADVEEEFWRILRGQQKEILHPLQALNSAAEKTKKISGSVVGGNLATICSVLGSSLKLNFKGRILFLEDIGERGYKVDRFLWQMQNAGLFVGLKAVVLGHFTDSLEPQTQKDLVPGVLQRFFRDSKVPVFFGLESGHGERLRTLPLGVPTVIENKVLRAMNPIKPVNGKLS